MIELNPSEFKIAVRLFQGTHYGVLAMGTLAGPHPGRVFVDDARDPQSGLVCARAGIGYYFLAGRPDLDDLAWLSEAFDGDFLSAQKAATGNAEVALFYYPQTVWEKPLFSQFSARRPIEIFKHRFTLPQAPRAQIRGWKERVTDGLLVNAYNRAVIEALPSLSEEICLFYGSIDAFLEHGFGVCALDGKTVASTCHAVFVGGGEAEISIATVESYRRRGLAQAAAACFIELCAARGLDPIWGCWPNNTASVALAQKIGFVEAARQPVCLWVDSDAWRLRE